METNSLSQNLGVANTSLVLRREAVWLKQTIDSLVFANFGENYAKASK